MKTQKVAGMGSVILLSFFVKITIDYPINILILNLCGYFISIITLTLINLIVCVIFVKIYDHFKTDILFIEKLKSRQSENNWESNLSMFINKWAQKGSIILFIFLSVKNPFIMVIYFREGANLYDGFSNKKIKLLTLLGVIGTTFIWNSILYIGFFLWEYLKKF